MVELQDSVIIVSATVAGQSLFVLQELVSILLKLWLGSWH
jgi:hypothetical protein